MILTIIFLYMFTCVCVCVCVCRCVHASTVHHELSPTMNSLMIDYNNNIIKYNNIP